MAKRETPVNITLAERIKYARKARKITQTDLAKMIGVTDQVIRNYELGHVGIPKAAAIAIATVLEFDAGYFLDESITEIRPLCNGVEAYKGIARTCFNQAKESKELLERIIDIFGDSGGTSLFDDVSYHCIETIECFTPINIHDSRDWWSDFWDTDNFEAFWKKWYETTERSF